MGREEVVLDMLEEYVWHVVVCVCLLYYRSCFPRLILKRVPL